MHPATHLGNQQVQALSAQVGRMALDSQAHSGAPASLLNTGLDDVSSSSDRLDPQLEMQRSQTQIAALLKRNHELSQAVFHNKRFQSSSAAASASLPSVSCMFIALGAISFVGDSSATSAWLCPFDHHDQIIRVPFSYNCSHIFPTIDSNIDSVSLNIFRPNTKRYSSPAFWCKIITTSASYSVNFFGARTEVRTETLQTVSLEHCRMMSAHHRCEYGIFPTSVYAKHGDCLVFPTSVYAKHGDDHPDALAGDMTSCKYRDGSCTLRDGSALIWSPSSEEACQFIPLGRMRGDIRSEAYG
ncbi:hypothetical protein COOONC_25579 [Cooperia oncophora]